MEYEYEKHMRSTHEKGLGAGVEVCSLLDVLGAQSRRALAMHRLNIVNV